MYKIDGVVNFLLDHPIIWPFKSLSRSNRVLKSYSVLITKQLSITTAGLQD